MDGQQTPTSRPEHVIEEARTAVATAPRPLGAGLVVVGIVHLLVPRLLLLLARLGYDLVLGVEFDPRSNATGRVRLVGLAMVAAGGHLLYHGGIRPSEP